VLAADRRAVFSHVGLVERSQGSVRVLHVGVGEVPGEADGARSDPIGQFLSADRCEAYAVYRIRKGPERVAERAVAEDRRHVERRAAFYASLDLSSSERRYCTELVWLAYRDAGLAWSEMP
jgi:hypothetical protein